MNNTELYFPKELSWLSFNERVLQEAADTNNPVIERLRFLGIYSNNLDEFYRVRVADVKRQITISQNEENASAEQEARSLMSDIQSRVLELSKQFDDIHKAVIQDLGRYDIYVLDPKKATNKQIDWVQSYFQKEVLKFIAPILIDKKVQLEKRLNDSSVYLYVALRREAKIKYAVIEIPTHATSRFVLLPPQTGKKGKYVMLLDNVIAVSLDQVFKGFVEYDVAEAYSFKITRDAEYTINDEIDESYVDKMSEGMKQRLIAKPVRIIHDQDMPDDMRADLMKRFKIESTETIQAAGHYRNFKDFIGFPNIGRAYLENSKLDDIVSADFARHDTVFSAIDEKDILLYYPYHRFAHVTEFVRQSAFDPSVSHIRMNIYRVASNSRIISSLIDAVDNGKKVTVVVELRARFDEENNIAWSKQMTDAGIRVVFGNPNVKIHSKLCVVTRKHKGKVTHYAHFGTGNFNEKTAKIYTDFSLFTANQELAEEAVNVFELIKNPFKKMKFSHLQVSPINARSRIQALIRQEIQHVTEGKPAGITFKVNNLVDQELVNILYQASQAGVPIRGIVRGMSSLKPGVANLSDNIRLISVVDRFLEHPRVMIFENAGNPKTFISSADWMTRNLDHRIEVGCPIYDDGLATMIRDLIDIQLADTMKARVIDATQKNDYVRRGNRKKLRSQLQIHHYLTKREQP